MAEITYQAIFFQKWMWITCVNTQIFPHNTLDPPCTSRFVFQLRTFHWRTSDGFICNCSSQSHSFCQCRYLSLLYVFSLFNEWIVIDLVKFLLRNYVLERQGRILVSPKTLNNTLALDSLEEFLLWFVMNLSYLQWVWQFSNGVVILPNMKSTRFPKYNNCLVVYFNLFHNASTGCPASNIKLMITNSYM